MNTYRNDLEAGLQRVVALETEPICPLPEWSVPECDEELNLRL